MRENKPVKPVFGKKLALNEIVEVEPKVRKRKPNFSVSEIAIFTEYVGKNLHIIRSKLTNNITHKGEKKGNLGGNHKRSKRGGPGESFRTRSQR